MATKTKAKPTASKKSAPKKAPAKKATKPKAPTKPSEIYEDGSFLKFTGYRSEMDKDDIVFKDGDTLYVVEVEDGASGILYTCINASDLGEFLENGDENVVGGQVAPSEVHAIKGGALEKIKEAYMPIVVMGKLADMLAEANGNAIEVAVELNQEIQETYFWLGGALAKVLQEGTYLTENGGEYSGDEAFNDFCQAEFGFKASKGRQLARIYQTFSSLEDFNPEQLAGIGWSIAAKIEKYVTEDNVDEVLEAAADDGVTQRNVDAIMKERFVTENTTPSGRAASRGGDKLVTKTMNFRLAEDAAEAVELAIQQCMKQSGIADQNLALERICTEWAQDHVETETAKKRILAKGNKAKAARERVAKAAEAPKAEPTKATRGKKK